MQTKKELEEDMVNLTRQTMRDYCRRTDSEQISLDFQLDNPITFDIKNCVLSCLRGNLFDRQAIRDPWEHLAKFYKSCSMCKTIDVTNDKLK